MGKAGGCAIAPRPAQLSQVAGGLKRPFIGHWWVSLTCPVGSCCPACYMDFSHLPSLSVGLVMVRVVGVLQSTSAARLTSGSVRPVESVVKPPHRITKAR